MQQKKKKKKKTHNQREAKWKADKEEREEGEINGSLKVRSAVTREGEIKNEIGEIERGWAILTAADDVDDGWARSTVATSEGERDWEESVRGTEVREREPARENRKEKVKKEEREKRTKNY